jgi:CRISPR system Cascade subunit CasB
MPSDSKGNDETSQDRFTQYVDQLESAAKAALRRSLAFDPGAWPGAFAYVEPWVINSGSWERKVTYLVAGLQVLSRAQSADGDLGSAAAALRKSTDSASVEQRFLALLDSDADELPHRLRQMVTLMSSANIAPDWGTLRKDLRWWRTDDRTVQQRWAKSYYRHDRQKNGSGDNEQTGDKEGEQNVQ